MFIRRWFSLDAKANVVICHGIGEHSGRYDGFASYLNRRGFGVFAGDFAGHGMQAGTRGFIKSFDDFTSAVKELADGVKKVQSDLPVFLFGHSMGGLIAARVVEEYPNTFKAVALSAPHLFSAKDSVKKLLPLISVIRRIAPKATFSSSSRFTPSDLSHNERAVQRYIEDPYVHDRVSPNLFFGLEESIEMAMANAAKIKVPVLIVYGSADRVVDPVGAQELYEKIETEKKILEILGGKHEMFADEERKSQFFGAISTFFSEHI
ncbi:MAG: lysophospholipase [Mesotoga sp.]|uniref:alpha/beta hydrolase n=1 Tax=Mesotoga sp. TaxID=2053577 RepID=UPI002612381B|nr:alpha/beta hydrolase [Mesotoga sp.]MDD4826957.1 lysophospholipase [Mesotoga sp.]